MTLIVLKRPPVTEKKIEEIEVFFYSNFSQAIISYLQMTEEDEVSVCAEGQGWMANAKEQRGIVKVCLIPILFTASCMVQTSSIFKVLFVNLNFSSSEFIETEGLATILSKVICR